MEKYYVALVGKNPMPIFMSALHLCDKDTNIYLIYSKEDDLNISTKRVAENIKREIEGRIKPRKSVGLLECGKSNVKEIIDSAEKVLIDITSKESYKQGGYHSAEVYVDYTGGTKIMSALIYDYFNNKKEAKMDTYLVYVSNNKRTLYINRNDGADERKINLNLKEISNQDKPQDKPIVDSITNLHGYDVEKLNERKWKVTRLAYGKEPTRILHNDISDISLYGSDKCNQLQVEYDFIPKDKSETNKDDGKQLIDKYFGYRSIAQKLGGIEVYIKINIQSEDIGKARKAKKKFKNNISNLYIKEENVELFYKGEMI